MFLHLSSSLRAMFDVLHPVPNVLPPVKISFADALVLISVDLIALVSLYSDHQQHPSLLKHENSLLHFPSLRTKMKESS